MTVFCLKISSEVDVIITNKIVNNNAWTVFRWPIKYWMKI
jgi:hypothetical protein